MTPATPRAGSPYSNAVADFLTGLVRLQASPKVYPLYIASRIKKALPGADSEQLLRAVGDIETIGDCKYAIIITDFNGTEYKITVEVKS